MKDVIIYHDNCTDGFCAAVVALATMHPEEREAALFVPAKYGDALPDCVDGARVLVLDFSYPLPLMEELFGRALMVAVLDHHRTSGEVFRALEDRRRTNKGVIHDESRSGARLAWDYLAAGSDLRESFPGYDAREDRWWIVDYVQDRDLWKWELPFTHEVSAAIAVLPRGDVKRDAPAWLWFAGRGIAAATGTGAVLLLADRRAVDRAVLSAGMGRLRGREELVPVVNVTHLHSEVLGELARGYPYAVGWSQDGRGVFRYSLRSSPSGMDVSEIAKKTYGGGGHPRAAGFETVEIAHELHTPSGGGERS